MVTQAIINKIPLSYRTLQKIKANEYQRFFSQLENYNLYVNHLGEIQWMKAEEANQQHEFFLHEERSANPLNKILYTNKTPDLDEVSRPEKEIRLQFRALLEETYLGETTPETQALLPQDWQFQLKKEELLHIPITLESLKTRDWKKTTTTISILLIVCISLLAGFLLKSEEKMGRLLVESNVKGGRVFLEGNSFLGYTGSVIRNLPIGTHRFSVKKEGFVSTPKFRDIEIINDSLQTVHFQLKPFDSQIEGRLKIVADQKDSDLFINHEYYGKIADYPLLTLQEGQYHVEVTKSGFITLPSEQTVNISPGDTTVLILEQVASSVRSPSKSSTSGMLSGTLDITSNVSGAQIYLNGRNTGKETDYVFTNLNFGQYIIKLVKDGFEVVPEEKTVRLTSSNRTGEVSFHLKKEFEIVTIETDQPNAQIYIDGEIKGKGQFKGPLDIGEHEISFGRIPGYNSPSTKTIQVRPRLPVNIEVKYFPQMHMIAEVTNNGNVETKDCNVVNGYTFANKGFSPSDEAGPEVVYLEDIRDYLWKFGYAFPLRNPKGNDALKLVFSLPHQLDYEQEFTLKIDAASSDDKYPLSLSRNVDIAIKFNNHILSYYYQPRTLKEIGGTESLEWDITPYIKPSRNSLEIATTKDNNAYYFVKRIEIFN